MRAGPFPSFIVLGLLLGGALAGYASPKHSINREGLTVDLDWPYEQVLGMVKEVAASGVIYGTSQYGGEENLTGAQSKAQSDAFSQSSVQGEAIYKVAGSAVSPTHFIDSNDAGTLTIRYLVRSLSPVKTSVTINAVFVENARRRRHESDGTVETSEFAEIYNRLKAVQEEHNAARKAQAERSDDTKTQALRRDLDQERAQLQADTAAVNQLSQRAQELARQSKLRIKVDSAPLKSAPFARSKSEENLAKNDTVTVLLHTSYWVKVKARDHMEGWLYYVDVEPMP